MMTVTIDSDNLIPPQSLPPYETVLSLLPFLSDEDVLGLDGVEVFYPGHTPHHTALLVELARQR